MSTTRKSTRSTRKPKPEEQFKEWSVILDIQPELIQGRYAAILDEKKKIFPELPETVLIPAVTRLLQSNLKRDFGSLISKAPPVRGFFVGASELSNFIHNMQKKAERESSDNWDKAIVDRLITTDGTPLDTREKLYGRDINPTYGRPLDEIPKKQVEESYKRTLYAVGYPKGSEVAQFFTVDFHADMALNLEYSLYNPVTWRANIIEEGLLIKQRATQAATRIRDIELELEYENMIKEACEIIELSEFAVYHGQNSSDWDRVVCGKANVAVVSDQPHPTTNSTMLILDDQSLGFEDMGHRAYVPDYLPIDFGEDTEIYFWGRTGNQTLRSNDEVIVVTNLFGMYPVGEMITPIGYKSGTRMSIEWDDANE